MEADIYASVLAGLENRLTQVGAAPGYNNDDRLRPV